MGCYRTVYESWSASGFKSTFWFICNLSYEKACSPVRSNCQGTGPRLLHSSQWGFIDPVDTPDGGNCGLHKYMAISTYVTSGTPGTQMISWLRMHTGMKLLSESNQRQSLVFTKVFRKWALGGNY